MTRMFLQGFNILDKLAKPLTIFMDGLDARPEQVSNEDYIKVLNGLVNATIKLNETSAIKRNFRIILLIRPDIIYRVSTHNLNQRMQNNAVTLNWTTTYKDYRRSKLFELADNYFAKQQVNPNLEKGYCWDRYFSYTNLGNQNSSENPFIDVLKLSLYRPRDIITILNLLKESVNEDRETFTKRDIASIYKDYSVYLKSELRDYLSVYMANETAEEVFRFIENFKHVSFNYKYFKKMFEKYRTQYLEHNTDFPIEINSANKLIQVLYAAGVLCYCTGDKNHWAYKERNLSNVQPKVIIDNDRQYRWHRAYAKAFGIPYTVNKNKTDQSQPKEFL